MMSLTRTDHSDTDADFYRRCQADMMIWMDKQQGAAEGRRPVTEARGDLQRGSSLVVRTCLFMFVHCILNVCIKNHVKKCFV